jgi:rubrerythrin
MPLPKDPIKAQLWRERQRASQLCKSRNAGLNNPFWGKQHTDETKEKISASLCGENNPMFGKERPQYIKDAVSKAHKGKISAFKGQTHSEESREKMSAARKGNKNRIGTFHTPAQRLKISEHTKEHALRGSDNPNWKGGVTPENIKARHSFAYQEWRRKVFERDNYTCQHCGYSKGGNLHPHHIKPFSEYKESRYDIDNGITLCKSCHEIVHGRKL